MNPADRTTATPEAALEHESTAKPPARSADDGKQGGQTGGQRHAPNLTSPSAGTNAQTGRPKGDEDERHAPGIDTAKHGDDAT